MVEFVLLALVPIAGWGGWWFARATSRRRERKRNRVFSNQYFQGLNYLLNEQPDKALQVFMEMAEVNEDTVETHLALGSLFRRRGEVDRAIRLHQNIISKHNLDDTQRLQALLELGEDYMRAGLFDRAERLFGELMERESQAPSALQHLLDIYQQEKDWQRALDIAGRLEEATEERFPVLKSHFCCELAEKELQDGNAEAARKHLRLARRFDPENARVHFIESRIAQRARQYGEAMDQYEEIVALDTAFLPLVLDPYFKCAEQAEAVERAQASLDRWAEQGNGVSVVLKKAALLEAEAGPDAASEYLVSKLSERPSVRGMDRLIRLRRDDSVAAGPTAVVLRDMTRELLRSQPSWRCRNCGFSGQVHHWQCPSCRHWSTTRPVRGVLGE
ncbi:MAG: lipopolysaccharide assembly protein LapB [Xanthomonadales bacterium]|nr:lipopolysaccharide assembly protein LapB [Xanthomonadales bacterium]